MKVSQQPGAAPIAASLVNWKVASSPIPSQNASTASWSSAEIQAARSLSAGTLLDHWHLLSLDAPTVAVVWSCAFARAAGAHVPWLSTMMLALATWLLYVADRLLDALQPSATASLQQRHHYHYRHRVGFVAAALPALAALTWFVTMRMDPAPRREDFTLAACAVFYLLGVHLPIPAGMRRFLAIPKEVLVAVIFAAACAIPSWSRQPAARPMLLWPAVLFAMLCCINCVAIEHWEQPNASAALGGERVAPHPITRGIGRHLAVVCVLLSAMALTSSVHAPGLLAIPVAVSALLLFALHLGRHRLAPLRLRAAADAVLLTPAIYFASKQLILFAHLR